MLNLPKKCRVDRFLPKKTFYEHIGITSTTKKEFVDDIDKKVKEYSLGMKQKLELAQAFMENPKILLLDEAFSLHPTKQTAQMVDKTTSAKSKSFLFIFSPKYLEISL